VADAERIICASGELAEAGTGVRFEVIRQGVMEPAFVVRFGGQPRAYLNRCAHVPAEMDWQPGEFFDFTRTLLICSMHGAQYFPESGRCYTGPCRNGGLVPLKVIERDGKIILQE
jgi:nitrite reductase/ring-hydroxylating ferredoxin subunit